MLNNIIKNMNNIDKKQTIEVDMVLLSINQSYAFKLKKEEI